MERKFAIITESSSDLPDTYYGEHDVDLAPMGYTMDDIAYGGEDGEEMEIKEFYNRVRAGAMPKTFQITPEQAKLHIEKFAKAGRDVLILSFSSGLSSTYQSYLAAAKEMKELYPVKVFVVDSLCASYGEGLFVDYVVKKADTGASIEETRDYAEELKLHICHCFTVDNLFHLKRGGRVSAATAVIGTALNIKPVLHVDNAGHLISIGKAMGRKKSISALIQYMAKRQTLEADDPVFISHGDCLEDAEYLKSLVLKNFGEREVRITMLGPIIGTHTGAGLLALFFKGSARELR